MSYSHRLRSVVLAMPLGLVGAWSYHPAGQADEALGETLDEAVLTPPLDHDRGKAEGQLRQHQLAQVQSIVQPDPLALEPEWALEVALPLDPQTQVTGGIITQGAASELMAGSGDRWQSQAVLGIQHQWKVAPGMEVELGYERMLGQLSGHASELSANRVKAHLNYQIRPHWQGRAKLEQRLGDRNNQLKLNAQMSGQLSPHWDMQVQAHHERRSDRDPKTEARVSIAYTSTPQHQTEGTRLTRETQLAAIAQYRYRQQDSHAHSRAHVLQTAVHYQPNPHLQLQGQVSLRQQEQRSAALVQVGMSHDVAKRWDVAGDLRWRQGLSASRAQSGLGATLEVGYQMRETVRLAAGYALGQTQDRDFERSRSSGPYIGLQFR